MGKVGRRRSRRARIHFVWIPLPGQVYRCHLCHAWQSPIPGSGANTVPVAGEAWCPESFRCQATRPASGQASWGLRPEPRPPRSAWHPAMWSCCSARMPSPQQQAVRSAIDAYYPRNTASVLGRPVRPGSHGNRGFHRSPGRLSHQQFRHIRQSGAGPYLTPAVRTRLTCCCAATTTGSARPRCGLRAPPSTTRRAYQSRPVPAITSIPATSQPRQRRARSRQVIYPERAGGARPGRA